MSSSCDFQAHWQCSQKTTMFFPACSTVTRGASRLVASTPWLVVSTPNCSQVYLKFSPMLRDVTNLITIAPMVLLYQSSEIPITLKASRNSHLRSNTLLKLTHLSSHCTSSRTLVKAPVTKIHFANEAHSQIVQACKGIDYGTYRLREIQPQPLAGSTSRDYSTSSVHHTVFGIKMLDYPEPQKPCIHRHNHSCLCIRIPHCAVQEDCWPQDQQMTPVEPGEFLLRLEDSPQWNKGILTVQPSRVRIKSSQSSRHVMFTWFARHRAIRWYHAGCWALACQFDLHPLLVMPN